MNKMRGVARQTRRTYGHLTEAWDGYRDWLVSLIRTTSPKRILEVGGGANPALSLEEVAALGVNEYTVLDISERELAKSPSGYVKICADICSDGLPLKLNYDLIISRSRNESVTGSYAGSLRRRSRALKRSSRLITAGPMAL